MRDIGLLESALNRPQQLFSFGEAPPDVVDLAASYSIAILQNHPFVDGNKRTAFVALETFLRMHGYLFETDDSACVIAVLNFASDTKSESVFVAFVRANSKLRD